MAAHFTKIILHPGKERSLMNRHPWLFSGAIRKIDGTPEEGDVVEVFSSTGVYLATGHFHNGSISVRVFSFEKISPGTTFWQSRLQRAYDLRKKLGLVQSTETDCYRLAHAEGDGLPGLIIDIYRNAAVIQSHTLGMSRVMEDIADALKNIYGEALHVIYNKSSDSTNRPEENSGKFLLGDLTATEVIENGIRFHVDFSEGQKTGFFLDQRENRKLLGGYAAGKKVLNTFAYSGGFSLYALKNNAVLVHSVDSSKKAAAWAEQNVRLNFPGANHTFYAEDVFGFFKKATENYDLVVLDPPAFAKHLSAVKQATIGYRNLNAEAMTRIAKGGILFTFSCSQVIDKDLFRKIIFSSALQAKRNVRILHQLSQPPDHPVSIYHPEGEYLKGLVLYVE